MKKKTISMILALMLLLSVLSGCSETESTATTDSIATEAVTDTTAAKETETAALFAGGAGTAEDPWQIATAEQLDFIRNDLTAHYVLIDDIDLSGYENWMPIGAFQSLSDAPEDAEIPHPDYAFTGTFDGAGHTISNLTVSSEAPTLPLVNTLKSHCPNLPPNSQSLSLSYVSDIQPGVGDILFIVSNSIIY